MDYKINDFSVVNISESKVNAIIRKVLMLENENLRTSRYNEQDIIKRIKNAIEESVNAD